jgi:ribonuclease HII
VGIVLGPLPEDLLAIVDDSKKLTHEQRQKVYDCITNSDDVGWGLGWAEHSEIDDFGVWDAECWAIGRALMGMCQDDAGPIWEDWRWIMDGNLIPKFKHDHDPKSSHSIKWETCVKGDSIYPEVSAASCLAKVAADKWLNEQPEAKIYEWEANHGYGTERHVQLIKDNGLPTIYRKSFNLPKIKSDGFKFNR